jgi:uncharacterized protein (TIGR02588 family)
MSKQQRGIRRGRTPLELGVLLVSVLAVLSVAGGLIAANLSGGEGPPHLRVTVHATGEQRSGGVVYEVTVRNLGGQTAENVIVEVTFGEESREVEILSVSKDDEEIASVVFPPGSTGSLGAHVLSYHETTRG